LLVGMKGSPASPGWLSQPPAAAADAKDVLWSVEMSGTRTSLPASDLEPVMKEGKIDGWRIVAEPSVANASLANRPVDVAFTVLQVSIFFSVYVFFQVWNQINCRSLTVRESGFANILKNPTFLAIASTIAVGQILIVTFGGDVFKVNPLSPLTWLIIIGVTASVLAFAEIARRVRLAMEK
jgi:magnesium-transporting ATPase (P-type)